MLADFSLMAVELRLLTTEANTAHCPLSLHAESIPHPTKPLNSLERGSPDLSDILDEGCICTLPHPLRRNVPSQLGDECPESCQLAQF